MHEKSHPVGVAHAVIDSWMGGLSQSFLTRVGSQLAGQELSV
jgi:hypothetical protein